jgi:hypothetical protein
LSNSNVTIDMVTREALRVLHEKATFIGTVNRSYDDSFAKAGAKIGDTLRVRKPNEYTVRTSGRVMDVQDQDEATIDVTVATQYGVDMRFNSAELALDIDDFSKRYIEPAVSRLVSKVDAACLETATKATYNLVGTAGTLVGASGDISALFNARAKLNQFLAPKDGNRNLQVDSVTMASIVNGAKALFHDGAQIKEAFREGMYARTAMADIYENERTYIHTTGSDHTTVTVNDAAIASGDTVVTTAGASVSVGSVFTFAAVYAVHPETKVSTGQLQQFVITAVNGNDWTISPALISTGAKQNVDALPANSSAITLVGSASTNYRHNLMYHKDAFTFVTADLPIMDDAHKCVRRTQDGVSMRVWQGSDIRNDELLMRIDLLWGFKELYPQWACRLTN